MRGQISAQIQQHGHKDHVPGRYSVVFIIDTDLVFANQNNKRKFLKIKNKNTRTKSMHSLRSVVKFKQTSYNALK